jgi:ABC-2 type transport system permease protein
MTSATISQDLGGRALEPVAATAVNAAPVNGLRATRSEWIKFRTLRSSWYTLLAAVLVMVAFAGILGYTTSTVNWATVDPDNKAASSALGGYHLAQLLVGVLGILFVTGEYATGMIRSTFAAVPRRLPVIGAKTAVSAAVTVAALTVASFAAFFTTQAFLSGQGHAASLSDPGALRAVAGTGVYLMLVAVMGGALGWIVRSTAGGISTLVGLMLLLPAIVGLLPASISDSVTKFLPSEAGGAFITTFPAPHSLGPWTGIGVFALWVAAALAFATVVVRRRDA